MWSRPRPDRAGHAPDVRAAATLVDGRRRVVIHGVRPAIEGGRFAIKRTVGERVIVSADIVADGHDALATAVLYRRAEDPGWQESPMVPVGNDRWEGWFTVRAAGRYYYTIEGWVDRFISWRTGLKKKVDAGQDVYLDLLIGAGIVFDAARRAAGFERSRLEAISDALDGKGAYQERLDAALSDELRSLMARYPDRSLASRHATEYPVEVDRERARFSTWYEMFPRSASPVPGRHGTFKDCEGRLPYIRDMGFDVLYLPPIHPIGYAYRKGQNNQLTCYPEDPGSPWAIGGPDGGHKAVHSQLGTLEDFRDLVEAASRHGIEIALDIAFQASPDHPYVRSHPEWFRSRPDGSIQYAENPPKKYQDIYPFDFESPRWRELWMELKSVLDFWVDQGIRIFRVDNPHTKTFAFWEWVIAEVKREHPETIFLAEAFTRPKVMYHLAKLGFTQSYTYFAWRNTRWELEEYFTELTQTEVKEYFRPNLWPNTPDILTSYLQTGLRAAFMARATLAATLGASYGIYGPAFELMEATPVASGSEEYLDSEKYQMRHWDIDRPDSLRYFIARLNAIRRENPALQGDWSLRFHPTDNERLICYSKQSEDRSNSVVIVVNLDPNYTQSGWVDLDLAALGLEEDATFLVRDLLTDAQYTWHGSRNYVELRPYLVPAHILSVEPSGARRLEYQAIW